MDRIVTVPGVCLAVTVNTKVTVMLRAAHASVPRDGRVKSVNVPASKVSFFFSTSFKNDNSYYFD